MCVKCIVSSISHIIAGVAVAGRCLRAVLRVTEIYVDAAMSS